MRSNVDNILLFNTSVVVSAVDRSSVDDCNNNDDKWDDDVLDTTEVVVVDVSISSIGNACNVVVESSGEGVSSCCFCKSLDVDDVGGGINALQ